MIKFIPILVVLAGIIGGVFLINNSTQIFSKADVGGKIDNVLISNITDKSFVVSYYTTSADTYTKVFYGNSQLLDKEALDTRDQSGAEARRTHYVVINNLQPSTEYTFMISGDPDRKFYRQKTAPTITAAVPLSNHYSGGVIDESGQNPREAIVYFRGPDGQLLSTYTQRGRFSIDVSHYLKKDLSGYRPIDNSNLVEFIVNAGIQGLGYYDMYGIPEKTDIRIFLEQGSLPFFKIKFPGGGGDAPKASASVPAGVQVINGGQPQNQTSQPGFMETIWLNISSLFGGR